MTPPSDEVLDATGEAPERGPDLAQIGEQERKLAGLGERQAALARRDRELTQAIAGAYIGTGDPAALEAEQREVRGQLAQLADWLPAARAQVDAGRVDACAAALTEWISDVAVPASDRARERIAWHDARVVQLEAELAAVQDKAWAHRVRAQLLTDSARSFVQAFGLAATPPAPPVGSPTEPPPKTEVGRLLHGDQLVEACRAALAALADDPDGDPALETAVETLLVAHPPQSMHARMAAQRTAWDEPHVAELARVDHWLREQLAGGPVPYDDLAERALAAHIAVHGERAPALGWGRAWLGGAAQRLGVFPVVRYDGPNEDQVDAAEPWAEDVTYWTLRRTAGLMMAPDAVRRAELAHGMRAPL